MQQERSGSAPEQEIALSKSDQHEHRSASEDQSVIQSVKSTIKTYLTHRSISGDGERDDDDALPGNGGAAADVTQTTAGDDVSPTRRLRAKGGPLSLARGRHVSLFRFSDFSSGIILPRSWDIFTVVSPLTSVWKLFEINVFCAECS